MRRASRARVVYYGHDIHYLRQQREEALHPGSVRPADIAAIKAMELEAWTNADLVWYPSCLEVNAVHASLPGKRADQLPLFGFSSDLPAPDRSRRIRGCLLFVGNFSHAPNVDAILWFARAILPLILRDAPTATLVIAGPMRRKKFSTFAVPV